MEKILNIFMDEINKVIGVRSVYLINNRGEILYPTQKNLTSSSLHTQNARDIIFSLAIFELLDENINELEMDFLNGKIYIHHNVKLNIQTKLGVHESFLVILADKNFNKAHLNLALNVSLANVVGNKKYKRMEEPVRLRKTSTLTQDNIGSKDFALVEKIKSLLT